MHIKLLIYIIILLNIYLKMNVSMVISNWLTVTVRMKDGSRYASTANGGTVTNDGWSSNDAKLVCRELGYSTHGENWN